MTEKILKLKIGEPFSIIGNIILNPRKCPNCKQNTLCVFNREIDCYSKL